MGLVPLVMELNQMRLATPNSQGYCQGPMAQRTHLVSAQFMFNEQKICNTNNLST